MLKKKEITGARGIPYFARSLKIIDLLSDEHSNIIYCHAHCRRGGTKKKKKKKRKDRISADFVITLPTVGSINVLPSFSAILHAAPTTISPIAESSFRERPLFVLLEKPRYRTDLPVVCERACTQNALERGRKRQRVCVACARKRENE